MAAVKNELSEIQKNAVELLGLRLNPLQMEELLQIADCSIASRQKVLLGVVNAAKVVGARRNPQLRESLDAADIVLADGAPIVWLSRLIGKALPERVAGIDIMHRLLERSSERSYRIYFLGARSEVLKRLIEMVRKKYPGVQIAGCRDGYFTEDEELAVAEEIGMSKADILFVGISSPKKEAFLKRWGAVMNVPVCHGVGGSFDVLAGVTRRAPLWMQKYGLEWLYRVIQEPRRMWKRYLVTNTIFIALSLGAIVRVNLLKLWGRLC